MTRFKTLDVGNLLVSTCSGSQKNNGPPTNGTRPVNGAAGDDDDDRPRIQRLRMLRQWLVSAVGGEREYGLAQSLLTDGASCRQIATEFGIAPSTAYRKNKQICKQLRTKILNALVVQPPSTNSDAGSWVRELLISVAAATLAHATFDVLEVNPMGCTMSPCSAQKVRQDFWAASLAGFEEVHTSLSFETLRNYILRFRNVLFSKGHYLGIWRSNSGHYSLDISRLFPELLSAIAFARLNRQQAVTNVRSTRTVWLADQDEKGREAA